MKPTLKIRKDLDVRIGDSLALPFVFKHADGTPVDITGWRIGIAVKTDPDEPDTEAIILKTNDTHTDPSGGTTSIILNESDTDVPAGVYVYAVRIRTNTYVVREIMAGNFNLELSPRGEI